MRTNVRVLLGVVVAAFVATAFVTGCGGSGGGIQAGKSMTVRVTPVPVSFGVVLAGDNLTKQIYVTNDGPDGPLHIESVTLKAGSSAEFTVGQPSAEYLEVNETATIDVTYSPVDTEHDTGTVVITHNGPFQEAEVPLTTAAQIAKLYFDPNLLDFGDIPTGGSSDKVVRIVNGGADTATIQALTWAPNGSDDFGIISEPTYPAAIVPGGSTEFTVRYEPTGGDVDSAQLVASYVQADSDEVQQEELNVRGTEVAPDITVTPGVVDFGWVALNDPQQAVVTVRNDGSDILDIDAITLDPTHAAVTLEGAPEEAVSLDPDDSIGLIVHFHATESFPMTTDAIAGIHIASNDPDEGDLTTPVYARIEAPVIRVVPDDIVEFNIAAQNFTIRREVIISNIGHAPLEIGSLSVEGGQNALADEFSIDGSNVTFPPVTASGTGTIEPNESVTVYVAFTNTGSDSGEVWGTLHIEHNDDTVSTPIDVNLHAHRGGAPTCEIALEPSQLNYGTVPHGGTKDMVMTLRNVGSGNCSYLRADVYSCTASLFPGLPASCSTSSASGEYSIISAPIPIAEGLRPGDTAEITVRYEPPDSAPIFNLTEEYAGFLQVTLNDPYGTPGDSQILTPEDSTPNLVGLSGISRISVLPDHIDFGLVTLGCVSELRTVTIYNSGSAPLFITDISPSAECTSEFIISAPGIPQGGLEVTTAAPLEIEVRYQPQMIGEANCALIIQSSDSTAPVISVPMSGEGTTESHQIDIFEQVAGQEVDILFVIDDSGSMCEEQDRLAANFSAFINHAQTWGNSYHLGVVSTCVQEEETCAGAGQLKSKFYPPERWVDNDSSAHFTENVDIGCDGGSDSQEAGLEAAHMALSLPHIHLSSTACTNDSACQAPDQCLPVDGGGICGGFNGGFLREDAALELVMLSDEEDQSTATPDFYVDFFKSIKGFANENFLHVHSIVGDEGSGCGDPEGTGTSAGAGDRYIYVSEQTNGIVESICNDSFADALSQIGELAFGLKVQFFLSRVGDPSTIVVSVRGTECTQGWTYDPPSNSIIFDLDGLCMPDEGDEIQIEYDAICFTL